MERCDADQEARILPPTGTTRLIAREEANAAVLQHLSLCPFSRTDVESRLRGLEARFSLLVGVIIGSGILGGAIGGAVTTLLTK